MERAIKATSLTRGAVYCWDDFKTKRLPQWYAAEVDRQLGLPENTTAAAIKKFEMAGAVTQQSEKLPAEEGYAAPPAPDRRPPAVRVQPRRAAKRRRTVAELLADHRPPNRKKREGDFVLSRWELAEASRGSRGVGEAGSARDDKAAAAAARGFLGRVEAAVSGKAQELAAAGDERAAAGAPQPHCVLDEVLATQTMGCACCRADRPVREGDGDGSREQTTVFVLPPRRPTAFMLPTPSLGRWPDIPSAISDGGERRMDAKMLKAEGKRPRVDAVQDCTSNRRRTNASGLSLKQQTCDGSMEGTEEDIELGVVTVGGLRFAVDVCEGLGTAKRILML